MVSFLISVEQSGRTESGEAAMNTLGSTIQELIVAASAMMVTCRRIAAAGSPSDALSILPGESVEWYDESYNNVMNLDDDRMPKNGKYDIVEIEASELLAKYTHYCQLCGKGFKRDANLRMHMRAHGDEYKTNAALINPTKKTTTWDATSAGRKYSCPQEGCRWNQKHEKFQPLKSVVCVKNHYKRSHCPKMYVCKKCNAKQFSVLSDLRTHEKHCGDLKWRCSCGTTFSRKDKLMGHLSLFAGHTSAVASLDNRQP